MAFRLRRNLTYLAALAGGALLAQTTTSHDASREARSAVHAMLSADVAHAASPPQPLAARELAPAREPKPPTPIDSRSFPSGRLIVGNTPHRLILFSFDDGPDLRTTPLLLDRLDAAGIKALFFLTAARIANRNPWEREQANLAREIVARGHLVGSHTVDHLQLPLLDDPRLFAQIVGAEKIFMRELGFRPTLFRPPGGSRSARVDALLAERDYTTVLWNLGCGDFQVKSAAEVLDVFRRVMDRRERENGDRGGIILLHDTYSWSVDAFQLIWAELWTRNCRLLERGEELFDVVNDLSFFHQPVGDALPGTPAAPARLSAAELEQRQAHLRLETAKRCAALDGF